MRRRAIFLMFTVVGVACSGSGDTVGTAPSATRPPPTTTQVVTTSAATTTGAREVATTSLPPSTAVTSGVCRPVVSGFPAPQELDAPEVDRPTSVATADPSFWGGSLPDEDGLTFFDGYVYGILEGVLGRIDPTSGRVVALIVDVEDADVASLSATRSQLWLSATTSDDRTLLIEVDTKSGCIARRLQTAARGRQVVLANSTEVWLDDRGRLSLIDADSGEVLRDLQAERLIDIGNWEATGVVGDAIAVVSYCGSIVSYDPGSGGVAKAEVRGGGDEQCGGRWSVSSIGIALADASATPNEPALGMVFDATNGVAVGSFAVPFDVKKVALDQAGGWVIGSNGEIWRLPALSVPPGEVFAACLEFPEGGSSRQFAVPGTVIPLGAVDVGGLSALEVFRDRMVGLVDGSLVVIDPTDGSSAIVGVPRLSLEGVSVAGEDLWLHHRGPQGESVLLRIGPDGCPRRQISTHLEVRKVLSTPHGLWLETADDVIEIDGMSGAGVLTFAEATSTWEPVSPAEFPPMTEFLSNAVAFLAVDDVIVLMGLCGDAVGISTTRQEAGFLSAERCDLTDWIAGEWGFLGWVIAEDGSTRWVLYDAVLVEVASGSLPGADIVMAVAADRGAYLLAGDGRFFFLGA